MGLSRFSALAPVVAALASAEAGVRLLSPARPALRPVPVPAGEYFEPAELERGTRFSRGQRRLALVRQVLQVACLTLEVARTRSRPPESHGLRSDAAASVRLMASSSLTSLPVSILSRRRARAVGLDTQSWSGWAADLARATGIGAVLAASAGAAISALVRRYPRGWWVAAAGGSVAAGGLFGMLAPVVLDPLFNDFEPLPDGPIRTEVLALAGRAGVRVGEVYAVDASRRTSGANAYVSGLGPTKRVVLFDTLLDRYSPEEVRVVVAHELSHVRHRDVLRSLAFTGLVGPPLALAVQQLSRELSVDRRHPPSIAALALAFGLVSAPVGMVAARLSRAIERRADAESLELSGDADAFIAFHRAVALQNVAEVDPPAWVRRLLASHPPTLERIGAAVAFRELAGGGAAA